MVGIFGREKHFCLLYGIRNSVDLVLVYLNFCRYRFSIRPFHAKSPHLFCCANPEIVQNCPGFIPQTSYFQKGGKTAVWDSQGVIREQIYIFRFALGELTTEGPYGTIVHKDFM